LSLLGAARKSRPKVLFKFRDYELKYLPRGKGTGPASRVPRLAVVKIPPKPLSFGSADVSFAGSLNKELKTFPHTTANVGSLQVGFPRFGGSLTLSAEDPPVNIDVEDAPRSLEAGYRHDIKGVGDVSVRVNSKGDWTATYAREVEDLGHLDGSLNSQLDWHVDLKTAYPQYRGASPVVTYGANQDGLRVVARVDHAADAEVRSSYTVQNVAGKYAPADLLHDGRVAVATKNDRHTLEASGSYDRRLPKLPVRGSLAYTMRSRPATLKASVDFDRYRLRAQTRHGQVSAAVGTRAELDDQSAGLRGRPVEVEAVGRAGRFQVSTSAKFREGAPKVRLGLGMLERS